VNRQPDWPVTRDGFIGRKRHIDTFRQALQRGLFASRTTSFAVLGNWGIGKSRLLLKLSALCSEPELAMLPVFISASSDIHDYLRFAETLLGRLADALLVMSNMPTRVRREVQNWRFKRASLGVG
jgi:predicted ATP-dependent serine protease